MSDEPFVFTTFDEMPHWPDLKRTSIRHSVHQAVQLMRQPRMLDKKVILRARWEIYIRQDVPIIWPLGSARSIYVTTSSSLPMVTFVMIMEFRAESTTVYGFCPLIMVSPQGSHVVRVSVTFGCTEASVDAGAVGRQEVVSPAAFTRQVPRASKRAISHTVHRKHIRRDSPRTSVRVDHGKYKCRSYGIVSPAAKI